MKIPFVHWSWMVLSLYTANAIWCYSCEKEMGSCGILSEFCWAGAESGCFTMNLYIGGSMISTEVGCLQGCKNYTSESFFMWHEYTCCFTDYCNA